MKLTSNKPYLVRAIYEWLVDNKVTPHIVIFADHPEANVPQQYAEDGKIILNISPSAAQNLLIDNDGISFNARFAGKPFSLFAPIGAVLALYANETGEGMMFDAEEADNTPPDDTPPDAPISSDLTTVDSTNKSSSKKAKGSSKKPPSLKVVK